MHTQITNDEKHQNHCQKLTTKTYIHFIYKFNLQESIEKSDAQMIHK